MPLTLQHEWFVIEALLDYNDPYDEDLVYPCRSCRVLTSVEDPAEFDPDYHYCGRSMYCIP